MTFGETRHGVLECQAQQLGFFLLESGKSPKIWHFDSNTLGCYRGGYWVTWNGSWTKLSRWGRRAGRQRTVHCDIL